MKRMSITQRCRPVPVMAMLLFLALTACSRHSPSGTEAAVEPAATDLAPVAKPDEPIEQLEARALKANSDIAARNDRTLVVQLADGKTADFQNSASCDSYEECIVYFYRGSLVDRQFHWLELAYWEGGDMLLVARKTGEKYSMPMEPHLSPDKKFFVVASDCEAFCDPGVYLWEIRNGELINLFTYAPEDYELFTFKRWNGSDVVEMTKTINSQDICKSSVAKFPVRLVKKAEQWVLLDQMNPAEVVCE